VKCTRAGVTFLLSAALLLAAGGQAASQVIPKNVNDVVLVTAMCKTCRVTLAPWGQLGGEGKEADGLNFSALRVTSNSSVVAIIFGQSELWRMDKNGNVLARIGRKGDGPGEFRLPWRLWVDKFDTTYVLDRSLARVSVFSPTGKYLRAIRIPGAARQVLPLGGSRLAITAAFYGEQGVDERIAALPLHIIRADTIVKSFGVPIRSFSAREAYSVFDQFIVPYGNSIVVIPYTYHYTIEQWDTTGTLVKRLVREPDWFKPFSHFVASYTEAPSPMIVGAWVDASSRLWVVSKHAAETWRDAYSKAAVKGEGGKETHPNLHQELLYRSTVDVIDLKKGSLLASTDIPFEFQYVLGNGILGQMKWDSPQGGNVVLYRVELRGQ
jgi:hypothetical protein